MQETRGWDEARGETYRMRVKETSDDYRYFPEPDLPPLHLDEAWLADIRAALPELPAARLARYVDGHGLSAYDAGVLVADAGMYAAFEAIRAKTDGAVPSKVIANFVTGPHARELKSVGANAAGTAGPSDPGEIARLLEAIQAGTVSRADRTRPPRPSTSRRAPRPPSSWPAARRRRWATTRRCSASSTRPSPTTRRRSPTTARASP